jgi:glutamate dehydrogenase
MQPKSTDPRQRLMADVIAVARKMAPTDFPGKIGKCLSEYYRNIALDDLRERSAENLAGSAISHLMMAVDRKKGRPKVRVFNPTREKDGWTSTHTIVEVATDDMPFLVDSMGMAINNCGLYIHLTVHPVMTVKRGTKGKSVELLPANERSGDVRQDSFMRFEIDRESDPGIFRRMEKTVRSVLEDVKAACDDWMKMRAKALDACRELDEKPPPLGDTVVSEAKSMLEWMEDGHFTFLGYREYELVKGTDFDTLKVVPDTGLGILRRASRSGQQSTVISRAIRRQARSRELLLMTKANARSTVHRQGYLDYIAVKYFDKAGRVVGEKRFLGLFTSVAYSRSPRSIPVLRHKVQRIVNLAGLDPASHGGKALLHILETFPRDELFQGSVEELSRIALGIYNLQERQRIKLFVRRDAFRRFFSCLVFVPRDRYNTQVRERIQDILREGLRGISVESNIQMSESRLARVHIIIRSDPEDLPRVHLVALEKQIVEAVRTWQDRLRNELVERFGEETGLHLNRIYAAVFPPAYVADVPPREATFDIERLSAIEDDSSRLCMSLYRPPDFPEQHLRFKIFHAESSLPISDVIPMLENLGFRVISEMPYLVKLPGGMTISVQDFEMRYEHEQILVPAQVNEVFQDAFENVWRGKADNDGFNSLVLLAGLTWRQVMVLRAFCRYLLQTGLPFSQAYMEQVLESYANIARLLVSKFESRTDPELTVKKRQRYNLTTSQALDYAMDEVSSLDADRIITAFRATIRATERSNYFQTDLEGLAKPYVSIKFDPRKVPDLPKPRPRYEVFVYSPRVEGLHLRGGKVARGGLRWSDRQEDFRTEILGLMKAQAVKNTLIVPVGAKGGFVAKKLPQGDREEIMEEVIYCYQIFVQGLLDITDNLVDDKIVPPTDVVRNDGDDPYLVVAADKGTASFSDIANAISEEYGFWLGDAFASGGSVGYDHKKMGITAKGGWEAVKRHFREIGTNIQTSDFTVAGIGDMSGDVFGNGVLLSRHTKLLAAFNHMHIFLDPDPDPETSFKERERLFGLPRSGWTDYKADLISEGGGVWSRSEKLIELSPQVRDILAIQDEGMTPDDLIKAILEMPVDLLWNGGIGTYVKASTETHADAGDRTNDSLRINGNELRCKVIGEGGNLGLTQLGRIEYALNDGRMNTDFIDNSAGVDCSDREVNIKILLNVVARKQALPKGRRKKLLADMTDEVSGMVLRDNYLQTQALSILESNATGRLREHAYLIKVLEKEAGLDIELEFLPNSEEIDLRLKAGKGLTRPELAVLVSYGKIALYRDMIKSNVPEDDYLAKELISYFPQPLQRRYSDLMGEHQLSREIISTLVTNSLVNRMGPVFVYRARDETGADVASVARAYTIAREVFEARSLWNAIEELDNKIHTNAQYSMLNRTTRLLKHGTHWFLDRSVFVSDIAGAVERFGKPTQRLMDSVEGFLLGRELMKFQEAQALYGEIGIPQDVARRMAGLQSLHSALDIVEVSEATAADPVRVAAVYFRLGQNLRIAWLREQVELLTVQGRWQAMARNSMRENLYFLQGQLTQQIIEGAGTKRKPENTVDDWIEKRADRIRHVLDIITEMRDQGAMDFPTLGVALQEIRRLTQI